MPCFCGGDRATPLGSYCIVQCIRYCLSEPKVRWLHFDLASPTLRFLKTRCVAWICVLFYL